jgi:hypothetical protein
VCAQAKHNGGSNTTRRLHCPSDRCYYRLSRFRNRKEASRRSLCEGSRTCCAAFVARPHLSSQILKSGAILQGHLFCRLFCRLSEGTRIKSSADLHSTVLSPQIVAYRSLITPIPEHRQENCAVHAPPHVTVCALVHAVSCYLFVMYWNVWDIFFTSVITGPPHLCKLDLSHR